MAVNGQFPTLMPTLYPGSKGNRPAAIRLVGCYVEGFSDLAHYNKTPAVNGENHFSLPISSTGARSSASSAPRPADHGRVQG